MKNRLKIENLEAIRNMEYNDWFIYSISDNGDNYEFLLKRHTGDENHASLKIYTNISDKKLRIKLMYKTYTNIIWETYIPLNSIRNKSDFWNNITNIIEKAHNNR